MTTATQPKQEFLRREEVLEALSGLQSGTTKRINHEPTTRVVATEDMVTFRPGGGQKILTVDKEGARSMVEYNGLSLSIANALSPETFSRVLTELFARKGQYAVTIRDNMAVGFSNPSSGEASMPVERVLRDLERSMKGTQYFRAMMTDGNRAAMIETVGEKQEPVVRGDLVRAGVMVKFSPIGTIKPLVQAYALRLSCTNGATSNTIFEEYSFTGGRNDGADNGGNNGGSVWGWYRDSIKKAYGGFNQIIGEYRKMAGEKIPAKDRAAVLDGLLKQAGISGDAATAIRARAMEEVPRTAYDISNLITWGTSHILQKPAQIEKALSAASTFSSAEEHARVCVLCHRAS